MAMLGAPRPLLAQAPTPPPHFAIRNVRIIMGTGETISGGTIVMDEGLEHHGGIEGRLRWGRPSLRVRLFTWEWESIGEDAMADGRRELRRRNGLYSTTYAND